MIKIRYAVLSAISLLVFATSLHAQGGCADSPEAPTVLLVLVGSLGMFYGSSALKKILSRSGKR
jgi:XrtJ-associated TM-motif-TM protein